MEVFRLGINNEYGIWLENVRFWDYGLEVEVKGKVLFWIVMVMFLIGLVVGVYVGYKGGYKIDKFKKWWCYGLYICVYMNICIVYLFFWFLVLWRYWIVLFLYMYCICVYKYIYVFIYVLNVVC